MAQNVNNISSSKVASAINTAKSIENQFLVKALGAFLPDSGNQKNEGGDSGT